MNIYQRTMLLFLLMSFANQSMSVAQRRGAIWVHGLNAKNYEWQNWSSTFIGGRQLESRNQITFPNPNSPSGASWQDYHTEQGVIQMTNNVLADATVNGGGDAQTIYFGFSMGGVVGREIDVNRQGNFWGIITSGSPLDGALIANSVRNGEAFDAMADGADVIIRGPLRQTGIPFIEIIGLSVTQLVRGFESVFDIFGLQQNGNQGTTDLMEGSVYMNSGVRSSQTSTPKVLIYGNENAPGCWRILSQAIGNGDDEQYVSVARTAGDVYEAAMWVNFGIAAGYGVAAFFTFGATAWLAAYYAYVAMGWMDGMNFWRSDADRNWNHLIGADIGASQRVCYTYFDYQNLNQCLSVAGPDQTVEQYLDCQQLVEQQVCYNYYAQVNGQSDAFIKAPSQTGYNSAWANNAVRIEALGVNHMEMDTHPAMRIIYESIFNGAAGADGFFVTQ